MKRGVTILMLCWVGAALADMGGSFQEGKDLGGSVAEGAFAGINSGAAEANVPAYGANPAETQYYQGGQGQLASPGIGKTQDCAARTPGSDKIANQECEAVNFLARNPQIRPQFNVTRNDPMVLGAKNARNDAESFFQSIGISGGTGSTTQCMTTTETTPAQYTTETCSSLREVNERQCTVGRVIDIDADSNFQCDRTITSLTSTTRTTNVSIQQCTAGRVVNIDTDSNFQCDQTVNAYETLQCRRGSSVTCTGGGDGCDQGGVVANSWAGDMATSWFPDGSGNYILQFGTIADNYWCGWAVTQDRTLTFSVRDVGLITGFTLTRAAFDDWILVQVNGATAYVGPYGGDRLQVYSAPYEDMGAGSQCYQDGESGGWFCYDPYWNYRGSFYGWNACYPNYDRFYCKDTSLDGRVQYGANSFGYPELATSWNVGLNVDLRPYLRNGTNTIFMRVIVAGCGEGAIQLTTRQVCPLQCSVSTRNDCATLEARSR